MCMYVQKLATETQHMRNSLIQSDHKSMMIAIQIDLKVRLRGGGLTVDNENE